MTEIEDRNNEFMTINDVANMLNLHVRTIERMLKKEEFCRPFRVSNEPKAVRYWTREMITNWIQDLKTR